MPSPVLNFNGIAEQTVSADYRNLPANAAVVVVNKTSGETMADPVTPVADGGDGSLAIMLPETFPSGAFYLKAQDSAGAYLAQSVEFYVA